MKDANRSIFRVDAVRRYIQGREKSVLPRFISPHTFIYLWILLGLLLGSSLVAWFTKIPVYVSGSAVVVRWKGKTHGIREGIVVVAFLPPNSLSSLQIARKLFLQFDGMGDRFSRSIIAIEPQISSPDAVQQRFALNPRAALSITQPAAVVIAPLEPISTDLPASTYVGSVGRADVEIGSRRAVSLLPLIGQFFEKQ